MEAEEVRKLILKAVYSDKWLYDRLVLKGGNALSLIYNLGGRSSLDLDFSIRNDFADNSEVADRLLKALNSVFDGVGIKVFDFHLEPKPKTTNDIWWGGYKIEFKLISNSLANSLDFRIEDAAPRSNDRFRLSKAQI